MPLLSPTPLHNDALTSALGEAGELEYVQLVSMLEHTQGIFALMLVRSNFTPALRDRLLERLAADLAPAPLSIVRVSKTKYNAAKMLAEAAQFTSCAGVLALVGLEDTPGMVVEGGKEMRRPPALASLNHGREALRRACRLPIIVWCSDWVYTTLREHAPDFFDHFTGLFRFENAILEDVAMRPETSLFDADDISPLAWSKKHQNSVQAALKFYEQELKQHSAPTSKRAHLLLGLADTLWTSKNISVNERLEKAKDAVTEALHLLSSDIKEVDWAHGQCTLAGITADLPTSSQKEHRRNLMQAIRGYKNALQVYTQSEYAYEWAMIQYNIARTVSEQQSYEKNSWNTAVTHYTAALSVFTRDTYPYEWAMTLNNLGSAYKELSNKGTNANIQKALEFYQLTLNVFTETDYPVEWATTQYNLGNTYRYLTTGERTENLAKAIVCYQAALRVRTETMQPYDWARVQFNMGLALHEQGELDMAWQAWKDAARLSRCQYDSRSTTSRVKSSKFSFELNASRQFLSSEAM